MIIYNFPYLVVPLAFGLGAPTIILDTVFKVFRGTMLIYAAGLDPMVPEQTRTFAARDAATLKKATLTAVALVALPAVARARCCCWPAPSCSPCCSGTPPLCHARRWSSW